MTREEALRMRIDPTKTWRAVEARLACERDPRRRRNLETVLVAGIAGRELSPEDLA
jgi:hypothetical protein